METPEIDERQRALEQVKVLVNTYGITSNELGILPQTQTVIQEEPVDATGVAPMRDVETEHPSLTVAETFYNIGALVILTGAWALVGINWGSLGSIGKIVWSLAVVALTYLAAIGLQKIPQFKTVAPAMYLATVATLPVAIIAILDAAQLSIDDTVSLLIVVLSSGVLASIGWFIHKFPIFTLGVLVYFSFAYMATVYLLIDNLQININIYDEIIITASIVLGLVYCLLAYLSAKCIAPLVLFKNALYGAGTLFILLPLFTRTGWSSEEVTVIGIIFPLIILIGVFASAVLKQSSMFAIVTFFLIIYIVKTTFVYFSDNIGWPASLMLSGFLTVAIGLGANVLAKRIGLLKQKSK